MSPSEKSFPGYILLFLVGLPSPTISESSHRSLPFAQARDLMEIARIPVSAIEDDEVMMPEIEEIKAICDNPDFMQIGIVLDAPFNGIVYAKGHYEDESCLFVGPGSGESEFVLNIPTEGCGSRHILSEENSSAGIESVVTLMFQKHPLFQGKWDYARKIRCSVLPKQAKVVQYNPYRVSTVNEKSINLTTVDVAMEVKLGEDPMHGPPVSNGQPVSLGSPLTMVIYTTTESEKLLEMDMDIAVSDCEARDVESNKIVSLTDSQGCVLQDKLMSPFKVIKKAGGSVPVLAYANIESFKFPDSTRIKLMCRVTTCLKNCPTKCGLKLAETISSPVLIDEISPIQASEVEPKNVVKRSVNKFFTHRAPSHERSLGEIEKSVGLELVVLSNEDIKSVLNADKHRNSTFYQNLVTARSINKTVCIQNNTFWIAIISITLLILFLVFFAIVLLAKLMSLKGSRGEEKYLHKLAAAELTSAKFQPAIFPAFRRDPLPSPPRNERRREAYVYYNAADSPRQYISVPKPIQRSETTIYEECERSRPRSVKQNSAKNHRSRSYSPEDSEKDRTLSSITVSASHNSK